MGVLDGKTFTEPRVLITGANGFMGTHMAEILAGTGRRVVATDIGPRPVPIVTNAGAEYAQCDLRDPGAVAALVADKGPFSAIYHIAGLFDYSASYADLYAVNVRGTENLLDAVVVSGSRPSSIVMWGAAGVYDFTAGSPATETAPVAPKGGYLTTKYCAERSALRRAERQDLPLCIVRPGGVYGPRSRYGVATTIFVSARGGNGPIYFGSSKNRAGTVHVEDVCRAAEFLSRRNDVAGEVFNVGDESAYTTEVLMRHCARHLGFPLLPGRLPLAVMRMFVKNLGRKAVKKGRVSRLNTEMTDLLQYDTLLDISKLRSLGWKAKHPDALRGLMDTIGWYEKEGWL